MGDLISIIVPVYKVEKYLHRCVDSLMKQTYQKLEIILVDDGSPDHCGAICDKYAEKDKRFKVIHQKNGGASTARNTGIKVATGELIGFVDSDDWCDPGMYELLYQLMQDKNADISMCSFVMEKSDGKQIIESRKSRMKLTMNQEEALRSMAGSRKFEKAGYNVWNKLFKRNVIMDFHIQFPEGFKYAEDAIFLCNYIMHAKKIVYSLVPKYHYCQNPNSVENISKTNRTFDNKNLTQLFVLRSMANLVSEKFPIASRDIEGSICAAAVIILRDYMLSRNRNIEIMHVLLKEIRQNLLKLLISNVRGFKMQISAIAASISPQLFYWLYKVSYGSR